MMQHYDMVVKMKDQPDLHTTASSQKMIFTGMVVVSAAAV